MRRTATAAALLLVPALLLTGCGSSTKAKSSDASSPPASTSATPSAIPVPPVVDTTDNLPTVTGAFGSTPTVKLPGGKPTDKFVIHTVTEGSGPTVTAKDFSIYNFSVLNWTTGKTLATAYGKGGAPVILQPTQPVLPALEDAVVGHKVGSRVVVVAPPAAASAQMSAAAAKANGVSATDTLVFVVDVNQRVTPQDAAQGKQVAAPAGMPSVDATPGKPATFTIPDAARKPKALQTGVLIKGTGPKVLAGETIVVQYTGALLADGKVFDSSWKGQGAFATVIGQGQVIPGWDQGLVGQTVGSRVLLSIPADLAYGAQGSPPTIPANAPLVFVVDILAAA